MRLKPRATPPVGRAAGWLVAAVILAAGLARADAPLAPKHKKWLEEEVIYIISDEEKKLFRSVPTDAERERFINETFWPARDPTPGTPENEYKDEHYRRIEYANQYFSEGRGENGWRTDRGRIYVMLGRPAQVTKYPWQGQVRPVEIWFYANVHPSLPNFFNVVFFRQDDASDYRLYSPIGDGPTKLAVGSGTENNPRGAFEQLRRVSAELARVSLTLLTDEPIDTESFTATMSSDAMLTRIFNIPNDRFTKEMLRRRQELKEVVKTRVTFEPQVMQVQWVPLRQPDGDTAVHLMLLLPASLAEMVTRGKDKYYLTARVSMLVRNAEGEQLFQQAHDWTYSYEADKFEQRKELPFAYEDMLPLPPGEYDVDFVFHNETTRNYYLARQRLSVPSLAGKLGLSPIVVYEEAVPAQGGRPFEFFDRRLVPSARHEFGRGEKLRIFFQAYLPPAGQGYTQGEALEIEYTLGMPIPGAPRQTEIEQILKQQFDAHGTVLHGKAFSLTDLPQGSYRLVVKVTDPATRQSAAQTLSLQVVALQGEKARTTIVNRRVAEDIAAGWFDYRRALCEAGQGRAERAVPYLERALQRNPELQAARAKLATIVFQRGEVEKTAALAQAARITSETPLEAVSAFLNSLERTGNLVRAIQLGEEAVAVLLPSEALYEKLAALYEKAGQLARAQEMRELALRTSETKKPAKGENR